MRFPNPSLLCTACFCTFLMSRGILRPCHLMGQGWAQAASFWAFCLQVHRVGPSVGLVGSPPRQGGWRHRVGRRLAGGGGVVPSGWRRLERRDVEEREGQRGAPLAV